MSLEQLEFKHRFLQGHMNKQKNKKGYISVILAIIVLSLVLVIGLAMTEWIVMGLKLSRTSYISAPAYYAAESGIEKTLYKITATCDACPKEIPAADITNPYLSEVFANNTSYEVFVTSTTPFSAKSIGTSNNMKRSIEINWEKSW